MPVLARPAVPLLDVLLLRRSVGALAAGRQRCAHCRRTPLVGERVHIYEATPGDTMVCDLCRHHRRQSPARTELVHPAGERAVRVRPRAAT